MVRVVTEATKSAPSISVLEISRGNPYNTEVMAITSIGPEDTFTEVLDLYTIDGSVDQFFYASAMIFSNDTFLTLTGLESVYPEIYTVFNTSVTVKYLYYTHLEVNHNFGRTEVLIPGYQTSISVTYDGSTTDVVSPTSYLYESNNYYYVNCSKLCHDDGAANYMFKLYPTYKLPNIAASNSSTYTNVDLAAPSKHYVFDYTNYNEINSDTVAYVATNNSLILRGVGGSVAEIIGISDISSLDSSMIITLP